LRNIRLAGGIGLLREVLEGKAEVQALEDGGVLWKRDADTVKLYFDPSTHLISKMVHQGSGMTGPVEVELAFSDYRSAGSLKLPFKAVMTQGGQPAGEQTFTERKINTGLSADLFKKPE
jgi:hypothetical protein